MLDSLRYRGKFFQGLTGIRISRAAATVCVPGRVLRIARCVRQKNYR